MTARPLWIYRNLLNWLDLYYWADHIGAVKMLPPEQLHMTLCTVRQPVEWGDLRLRDDEVTVEAGSKPLQIFGYVAKGVAFGHPEIKARHEELAQMFPQMDHPTLLRPHVTLFRGGRMTKERYEGELRFGPEQAEEFRMENIRSIKHLKVKDVLAEHRDSGLAPTVGLEPTRLTAPD